MIVLFSILPFFSTALGGMVALRLRHRLHPIMAFSAGVLVATALANLLPEASEMIGQGEHTLLAGAAAVAGYLLFSALETLVHQQSWEHQHPPAEDPDVPHKHLDEAHPPRTRLGLVGSSGVILHGMLDGLAIGLGFHADAELGLIVGLAVLAHDFADGMNVVTLALGGGSSLRSAVVVLVLDAIAPATGVLLSNLLSVSSSVLGILLAAVAGMFVAVGAGHLLPEAQHRQPGARPPLVLFTAAGAAVVLAVRTVIG